MGRNAAFQIDNLHEITEKPHDKQVKLSVQGRRLFPKEIDFHTLWNYDLCEWKFSVTKINENFSIQHYYQEYNHELLPI